MNFIFMKHYGIFIIGSVGKCRVTFRGKEKQDRKVLLFFYQLLVKKLVSKKQREEHPPFIEPIPIL